MQNLNVRGSETVNQLGDLGITERRRAERIFNPFPAVVEGVDANGEGFRVNTVLDNLSIGGVYLRMVPCVDVGAMISVIFRLSGSVEHEEDAPKVAIKGEVLRVDQVMGGACGVALKYSPARFI